MRKLFSVIIPTLNSERTLEMCLRSIVNQSIGKENIEILVIDGGSKDRTREIALDFGAKVLDNERGQQEFAKHIGILKSSGKYLMFLDSDEILQNDLTMEVRNRVFEENPKVKLILFSGYITLPDCNQINYYLNSIADPFSYFIYRENKSFPTYVKQIIRNTTSELNRGEFLLLDKEKFKKRDVLVDMCASNTIDRASIFELVPDIEEPYFVPKIFYLYLNSKYDIALMKDQPVLHYSSENLSRYLRKLRWKVIVNVHYRNHPGTGFSNRNEFLSFKAKVRKYLFIPYSLSIIFPLIHSVILSLKNRNAFFLIHSFLSVYVCINIILNLFMRLLGVKPKLESYGGR